VAKRKPSELILRWQILGILRLLIEFLKFESNVRLEIDLIMMTTFSYIENTCIFAKMQIG
jgi:hypothetical protein